MCIREGDAGCKKKGIFRDLWNIKIVWNIDTKRFHGKVHDYFENIVIRGNRFSHEWHNLRAQRQKYCTNNRSLLCRLSRLLWIVLLSLLSKLKETVRFGEWSTVLIIEMVPWREISITIVLRKVYCTFARRSKLNLHVCRVLPITTHLFPNIFLQYQRTEIIYFR